jgi:eukaryotic-like serine/threonine-protein kinase
MSTWNPQANDLFLQALELRTPGERHEYLIGACNGDGGLRAEVEALLKAGEQAGSFLESPALAPALVATVERPIPERPGTTIGPYKLLEQIGEGGFGAVFMAEQQQPVRRKVALKVIKPGMDSRQVIARFEAERQALALMDHPNIAHVFDGGTTDAGRPYFVMELVRGVPMTEFCDQSSLPIRQRLELFVDVCQAIQHAHQKGIIHRDVKPTNVLVTLHDGKPVVKVIDFGIAKAMGQQLTEKTLFTNFAQLIGTPLYMSPEQAEMSGLNIDTRSDIYSLGVLLYELLTGTTPFESERLTKVGYDEMRRIIREEEPPKPSTRISTIGKLATTASQQRQGDPRKLSKLFRGELDWIVMKALEKDRERRYETASGLAADVLHYLKDEPVLAGPPSPWYRLRKFARRNRLGLAAAASILLLVLSLGLVIDRERKVAGEQQAREAALDEKVKHDLDEADALIEQNKWPEALAVVQRTEKLLAAAGRQGSPTRIAALYEDLAIVQLLEDIYVRPKGDAFPGHEQDDAFARAFAKTGIDLATLPVAEAGERIRARRSRQELVRGLDFWSLARKYANNQARPSWKHLLQIAKAADQDAWRNHLRDALEAEDAKALQALAASADVPHLPPQTLVLLGRTVADMGFSAQAVALLRQAHMRFPADLWINDTLGWQCLDGLHPAQPEESLRYFTAALALRPGNPRILCQMGSALIEKGSTKEAMAVLDVAIELSPNNALAWFWRARCNTVRGDDTEAIADSSVAIELDPQYHAAWVARAYAQMALGHYDKALADCNKAIELDDKYWWAWHVRGEIFQELHRDDEALAELNRAVELAPEKPWSWFARASVYISLQRYDRARNDYSKAIELGSNNAKILNSVAWLIIRCADAEFQDSNKYKAVQVAMETVGLEPTAGRYWNTLGVAHYRAGNWKEPIAALEKSMELRNGGNSFDWFFLAMARWQLGDKDEARKWFDQAVHWMDKNARHDKELLRFLDEAAALLGVAAKDSQQTASEADNEDQVAMLKDQSVSAEGWCLRADVFAERGEWDKAAANYALAFAGQGSANPNHWFEYALIQLQLGDAEGYRKTCGHMLERFGQTTVVDDLVVLAHTCVVGPGALGDGDRVRQLAEQRLAQTPPPSAHHVWSVHVLGLACYRDGSDADAVACLEKGLSEEPGWDHAVLNWLVLAMAEQHLGHAARGKEYLDKADDWIARKAQTAFQAGGGVPLDWRWRDWLMVQLFRREAGTLSEGRTEAK